MKLDSKQMHIVSQLFMAAGKAGKPFDLARFTKEPAFASETMAQLLLHADESRNESLQSLAISALEQLANMATHAAPAQVSPPAISRPVAEFTRTDGQQYVGRLR
jgi:hypothetical protein